MQVSFYIYHNFITHQILSTFSLLFSGLNIFYISKNEKECKLKKKLEPTMRNELNKNRIISFCCCQSHDFCNNSIFICMKFN